MSTIVDEQRRYWDDFYKGDRSANVPRDPSAFATWVADQLRPGQSIVECGFGNARDSFWFAHHGHAVRGFDFATSAVQAAQGVAAAEPSMDAGFQVLDLSDHAAVDAVADDLRTSLPGHTAVYGRFLIHSLEDDGRHNLIGLARSLSGELYVEFRTGKDAGQKHLFGDDHYRTYLDPQTVVAEIEERGGTVMVLEQGHGMAVYKSEDPHVARIVASWGE
jgi:hypothetical protein